MTISLLWVGPSAHADFAFHLGEGFTVSPASQTYHGWGFTVTEPITVTHLGLFDAGGDGLSITHRLFLIELGNPQWLASENVAEGSAPELVDQFRFTLVRAGGATLYPGRAYGIVADYFGTSEPVAEQASSLTVNSPIVYGGALSGPYLETLQGGPPNSFFGPSFQFVLVPEPSVLALGGMSFGFWLLLILRRRAIGQSLRKQNRRLMHNSP